MTVSITKRDVIYGLIILVLLVVSAMAVNKCSNKSSEFKNNIEALNDTIRYYQNKHGNLVATKLAFETELKDLKSLNKDLYEQIKNLEAKGKVTSGVHFEGYVENPPQDTTYIVSHDTITKGFSKDFAFNNQYRTLEGKVSYKDDTVGVKIDKDVVMFDYTVALDNKNNIMISSNNPYVKYNQITGFQIPTPKKKHWFVGPSVGVGYDVINKKVAPTIGVSVGYGLFSW